LCPTYSQSHERHHGPLFIGSIQRLILRKRLANRPFHHKMKSYIQNISVMRDAMHHNSCGNICFFGVKGEYVSRYKILQSWAVLFQSRVVLPKIDFAPYAYITSLIHPTTSNLVLHPPGYRREMESSMISLFPINSATRL
jgi:hypothetical protein